MKIDVHTKEKEYSVILERGVLAKASQWIRFSGQIFIVSDDGVPAKWVHQLQEQFPQAETYIFPNGEGSKNFATLQEILKAMQKAHLSRQDTLIAIGGGVVGDMAGFASAIYMRGIRYINIPTTSLSQIDSSIGGKTAIDFNGIKNSVGAFWQPDLVLADPDVLATLPARQLHNGLAEAVKEGMIRDPELFAIFEKEDAEDHLEEIIARCLKIKKDIVEKDEKENGERKLLNFGHTFGHAYEAYFGMDGYLHGECVGLGMLTVLNDPMLKERLRKVLQGLQLPTECQCDPKKIYQLMLLDKKADHDHISMVQVDTIGQGYLIDWSLAQVKERLGI
ncbi:MAG: 3-dehydroquinate synthase [Solobacterium sp.]|jgi:3-dehydroquinate synthase|nr:3-dehydroquinate synthase [Solobacterium sp.]MCH4206602.1 3-dehydroquinate synthase [Solobacterium sp.]MCH4227786.1 3-dehydroquinate synthase [Solobacterium sp.]MCH4283322.1 3-dehydroquinate synthase [Solobacterium sp.]